MKLPKIDSTLFEAVLPSTGEKIRYRAFTLKEEKILLIAKESKELDQIILAIKQILTNCVYDKEISELAVFDVEYLLTIIRGKSVNNIVEFVIKDPDTQEDIPLQLDINDIQVIKEENHSKYIKINEHYTLVMKYPSYDTFIAAQQANTEKDPLILYDVLLNCMDKLVSEEIVYDFKDFTKEEIDSFVEDLPSNVMENMQDFFETMPRLRHSVKYKNSKGEEKTFVIEGTESFFI